MSSHTSLPWKIKKWEHRHNGLKCHELSIYHPAGGEDGYWEIVVIPLPGDLDERVEQEANARLIAAAPELLEAAKQLQWVWQQSDRFGDQVPEEAWRDAEEALSRAIAKAEGREES